MIGGGVTLIEEIIVQRMFFFKLFVTQTGGPIEQSAHFLR